MASTTWAACMAWGRSCMRKMSRSFTRTWEGRVYALTRLVRAGGGRWNIDAGRYEIERIPAAEYLRMSYYERWAWRLPIQVVKMGLVTQAEVDSGTPAPGSAKATPQLTAARVPAMVATRVSTKRDVKRKGDVQAGAACACP